MDRTVEETWAREAELPALGLRQTVALHLIKMLALEEQFVPDAAQTDLVMAAFEAADLHGVIDPRTWRSWFGERPRRIRPDSLSALDRYLSVAHSTGTAGAFIGFGTPLGIATETARGGLLARLLERTNAKQPIHALQAKATDYVPLSSLNAHLDSLEVVALAEGSAGLSWQVVKRIGALRLLDWIHERWNPRSGSVYGTLSSDLKLRLDRAREEERQRIKASYARTKPRTLFDRHLATPARPDWDSIGVAADIAPIHSFKLMMALAADNEFLVADRFEAWLPDFVSAGLAMHSLAWTDRYTTHGVRPGAEAILWVALWRLMYQRCGRERLLSALQPAFDVLGLELTSAAFDTLLVARHSYWRMCSGLGVQRRALDLYARRAEILHRVTYGGLIRTRGLWRPVD